MSEERSEVTAYPEPGLALLDNANPQVNEPSYEEQKHHSFLWEVRHLGTIQFKVALSVCVAFVNGMAGWSRGQAGAAFLDILSVSGTDLEKGSVFITSFFTGRMTGAVFGGALYSRFNTHLMLIVSLAINSLSVALIPWCTVYELMVVTQAVHGVCIGVMSVVVSAVAVSIWGPTRRGNIYLHIFFVAQSLAGLISPIVTSPFLLPVVQAIANNTTNSGNSSLKTIAPGIKPNSTFSVDCIEYGTTENSTSGDRCNGDGNVTANTNGVEEPSSEIYIAYSISAGLVLLCAFPFIFIYIKLRGNKKSGSNDKKSEKFMGPLSLKIKLLQMVNIGVFAALFTALDYTYSGYLSVFCVWHLKWSKTSGSLLTSVFFLFSIFGRLVGAFLSYFLKPIQLLLLATLSNICGLIGFTLSGVFHADVGIWLFTCVIGLNVSIILPTLLSWVNGHLIPVRGKILAYLMIYAFLGALLSPLLLGYLMEKVSPGWFCFLCLAKSVVCIFNVMFMYIYTTSSAKHI